MTDQKIYKMCVRKIAFRSKNDAKKYGKNFSRKYKSCAFRVYQCPTCDKWHLTKRDDE